MRIVVIRAGALGDTLLTLPALALLRRQWPGARLTFVGRRDTLALVAACGLADVTFPYDLPDWAALFGEEAPGTGLAATSLRDCDMAVAWLPDMEGTVTRTLRALGIRRVVVAPGRPAPDVHLHAALYLVQTLVPLGIAAPAPGSLAALSALVPLDGMRSRPRLSAHVSATPQCVVAIHPGSGGAAKRWPPERFAAIAARLAAASYTPLLVQGPQDAPVVEQVLDALAPEVAPPPVVADLSLAQVAAVIERCAGFLGNDSGVSHLAGLLGIPTLALFGPSDPAIWSPLGLHARTLHVPSRTMDSLDVEPVWGGLHDLLSTDRG